MKECIVKSVCGIKREYLKGDISEAKKEFKVEFPDKIIYDAYTLGRSLTEIINK